MITEHGDEFEEFRRRLLRQLRWLWSFAAVAELSVIVLLVQRGEWVALPPVVSSTMILFGSRFLLSDRVLTALRHLAESS